MSFRFSLVRWHVWCRGGIFSGSWWRLVQEFVEDLQRVYRDASERVGAFGQVGHLGGIIQLVEAVVEGGGEDVFLGGLQRSQTMEEGLQVEQVTGSGQSKVAQPELLNAQLGAATGGLEQLVTGPGFGHENRGGMVDRLPRPWLLMTAPTRRRATSC